MVRVAVRVPAAVGEKVTLMVQVALTASEGAQALVEKSAAFGPEMATLLMESVPLPMLVSTVVSGALLLPTAVAGKAARVAGFRVATPAEPVPVRLMVGTTRELVPDPVPFLPETTSVPVRVPLAVGLKVTLIVQLAPAFSEVPQVLVSEKSPVTVNAVSVIVTVPVLVRVRI